MAPHTSYTAQEYKFTFLGHWHSNYKSIWRAALHWRTSHFQKASGLSWRTSHHNFYSLISGDLLSIYKQVSHLVFVPTAPWLNCLSSLGIVCDTVLQVNVLCIDMQTPMGTSFVVTQRNGFYFHRERSPSVVVFLKLLSVFYHSFP